MRSYYVQYQSVMSERLDVGVVWLYEEIAWEAQGKVAKNQRQILVRLDWLRNILIVRDEIDKRDYKRYESL